MRPGVKRQPTTSRRSAAVSFYDALRRGGGFEITLLPMNDHVELRLDLYPCSETATDVMAALLADAGCESFVPDDTGLTAYAPRAAFNADAISAAIASFPLPQIRVTSRKESVIEGRDWNAEWEKHYFKPIVIADKCVIHSSFHSNFPQCPYDITIDPKMAFGTGHHATTSLIAEQLLEMPLEGHSVLDMGTGTGILAILAAMRGASPVTAIEIDPAAHANAVDNVKLNGHPEIAVRLGDAARLKGITGIDLFIANINRNVITGDMASYAATLRPGATVLLSGFYVEDIPMVAEAAAHAGLVATGHTERQRWACLRLTAPTPKP